MTARRHAAILALLVVIAATTCRLGPGRYRAAERPAGVGVQIEINGQEALGELLEADAEALTVLIGAGRTGRIIQVPYGATPSVDVAQFEDLRLEGGSRPPAARLAQLQRLSRFPQGMTPEIERALLTAYGLEKIETP